MIPAPALGVQILAEIFGTFFLIFAGCAAVAVNLRTGGTVTFPGICAVWGLVVMVLVYSVAFATCGRFPWKQVGTLRCVATSSSSSRIGATLHYLICDLTEHDVPTKQHQLQVSASL